VIIYIPASVRDQKRKIAMVKLLAQAKRSPITIHFHGTTPNNEGLWSITNEKGETLALQGTEEQVCQSLANW